MKKLITLMLVFAAAQGMGQGFEGTLQWSMKMEITDPKAKADMEKAQKEMNSPENQAKMKEFEKQMNDPQMKQMMEANPQMKAQMEARMKMMQGAGGGMNSMLPTGFAVKIKGGNRLTIMQGGMAQEILYLKDKDQSVRLDRQNKSYSILPKGSGNPNAKPVTPKITKTGETSKILGYTCTKYLVEVSENGQTITQTIWTTTDIKDFDLKHLAQQRMGQGQSMFYEGIDGVPLKMEMSAKGGNMVMEATEIKRETLNAADFSIPADFKEVKMQGRF